MKSANGSVARGMGPRPRRFTASLTDRAFSRKEHHRPVARSSATTTISILTRPIAQDTVVTCALHPHCMAVDRQIGVCGARKSPLPRQDGLIGPLRSYEGAEGRRVPWCTGTYCASIRTGPNSAAATGSIRLWGSSSSPRASAALPGAGRDRLAPRDREHGRLPPAGHGPRVLLRELGPRGRQFVRDQIRSVPPGIRTIVGGRHATQNPEQWLSQYPERRHRRPGRRRGDRRRDPAGRAARGDRRNQLPRHRTRAAPDGNRSRADARDGSCTTPCVSAALHGTTSTRTGASAATRTRSTRAG